MVGVAGLHPRVYKLIALIISHNANAKETRPVKLVLGKVIVN